MAESDGATAGLARLRRNGGILHVVDGETLTFRLDVDHQPIAMAVWRNLDAWPADQPYRSVAIEPAIGWHFDRDLAVPGEVGVIPETGRAAWRLVIETANRD